MSREGSPVVLDLGDQCVSLGVGSCDSPSVRCNSFVSPKGSGLAHLPPSKKPRIGEKSDLTAQGDSETQYSFVSEDFEMSQKLLLEDSQSLLSPTFGNSNGEEGGNLTDLGNDLTPSDASGGGVINPDPPLPAELCNQWRLVDPWFHFCDTPNFVREFLFGNMTPPLSQHQDLIAYLDHVSNAEGRVCLGKVTVVFGLRPELKKGNLLLLGLPSFGSFLLELIV